MKTKNAFQIGQAVQTPTATGTIKALRAFAQHTEYLVEFADHTAHFVHEEKLKPAINQQPSTKN